MLQRNVADIFPWNQLKTIQIGYYKLVFVIHNDNKYLYYSKLLIMVIWFNRCIRENLNIYNME